MQIHLLALAASLPSCLALFDQIPLKISEPTQPKAAASLYWYEQVVHNGKASYMQSPDIKSYVVTRNVVSDFGADNTGKMDASGAIQSAITWINSEVPNIGERNRSSNSYGTTGQPAVVYFPSGTYLMTQGVQMSLGTVLMGDPTNPPVLKASSNFKSDHIIYGKANYTLGTDNFYIGVKNLVIDSTLIPPGNSITLLDWTVSQATQLANVAFNMPDSSTGHIGISTSYDYNSNIILNNLTFNGGVVGMALSGQQWVIQGVKFQGCNTAIDVLSAFNLVVANSSFTDCGTGIAAAQVSGSLTLLDSSATAVGSMVSSTDTGYSKNSIILENIKSDSATVVLNNNRNPPAVQGNVADTWVHGNMYSSNVPLFQEGAYLTTSRPSSLLVNGQYFYMAPPTFQEFTIDQVVNIKTSSQFPIKGDGFTDDTVNINAIIQANVGKVIYFPASSYIVTNTIYIPPGSRIIGEAYGSIISANGSNFYNPNAPIPMVQLGKLGEVGIGQIVDIVFTVADVLQGCLLLEVNMAGKNPGDVAIHNSHFRVGGAAGTLVRHPDAGGHCGGPPESCKAAWGMLHLTPTSSAYISNMWGWTADHDIDAGQSPPVISTGRGALIEARNGTWLIGTAFEHNTLYQYNFNLANDVASVFQQSETPYWQGPGNDMAPAPWKPNLVPSDPTFQTCGTNALCAMAWFEIITGSNNIFLYGGCVWVFFNNNILGCNTCQGFGIEVNDSIGVYLYGINTKSITEMIVSDNGKAIAHSSSNPGGSWGSDSQGKTITGGVIAAYLFNVFET